MKITKELKEVIARKLRQQEKEERLVELRRREEIVEKVRQGLEDSQEFKNLVEAATVWQAKVDAEFEKISDIAIQRPGNYGAWAAWNMKPHLNAGRPAPFVANGVATTDKYDQIQDTIILKLAYGKDFEEAKAILESYGINLD